jgi:murein tripeptide amidase MpaA
MVLMILLVSFLGGLSRTRGAEAAESPRVIGIPPWQDWIHYHNYTEIVDTLFYLNAVNQSIVDVFEIGKSWENRSIYCIRLTNESNTHPKPQLFFVGYHHAREPISAELALYFVVQTASGFGHNATITRMLNYAEIYVVVALNVDGFEAFKNNEWQRKTPAQSTRTMILGSTKTRLAIWMETAT